MKQELQDSLFELFSDFEIEKNGFTLSGVKVETVEAKYNITLLDLLEGRIYSLLHARNPVRELPPNISMGVGGNLFPEMLSKANNSRFTYEKNWTLIERSGRKWIISKAGLNLCISDEFLHETSKGASIGEKVAVKLPAERKKLLPGFYVTVGEAPHSDEMALPGSIRAYWNATPEAALILVDRLTRELNAAGEPFILKALVDATHYSRSDSVVLYILRGGFERLAPVLRRVQANVEQHLMDRTSAFAKRLALGFSVAETPSPEMSFGHLRSRQVAKAVLSSGSTNPNILSEVVDVHMKNEGVNTLMPHLIVSKCDPFPEAL